MEKFLLFISQHRYLRHAAFWIAWVFGFTFLKSVGEDLSTYSAWLVYYIITLPVFMAHTYLLAYWAIPTLLKGWRIILFVIVFAVFIYIFSFVEILITQQILESWFPEVFTEELNIKSMIDVLVSGVGNLYIVLVFIAFRQIREWSIADEARRNLEKRKLELTMADTKAGIQPNMLLHVLGSIEQMAEKQEEETSNAIALLSELLGSLMQAKAIGRIGIDQEILNVKKLCQLYKIIYNDNEPRLRVDSQNSDQKQVPAFIVFSPLEITFRTIGSMPGGPIDIQFDDNRETIISIKLDQVNKDLKFRLQKEMEELYPGKFLLEIDWVNSRCGILIREVNKGLPAYSK